MKRLLAAMLVATTCACAASQPPPITGSCRVVARLSSPDDRETLSRLYGEHLRNLVVAGRDVLLCDCGSRALAGGSENRNLAGGSENRNLAGGTENRDLAAGSENRNLAGGMENRDLAGGMENRDLAGGVGVLMCSEEPVCAGYRVSGSSPLLVFDGTNIRQSSDRCVPW